MKLVAIKCVIALLSNSLQLVLQYKLLKHISINSLLPLVQAKSGLPGITSTTNVDTSSFIIFFFNLRRVYIRYLLVDISWTFSPHKKGKSTS